MKKITLVVLALMLGACAKPNSNSTRNIYSNPKNAESLVLESSRKQWANAIASNSIKSPYYRKFNFEQW